MTRRSPEQGVLLGSLEEQVMLAVVRTGAEAYGMTVRRELAALLEAAIDELPDGYRSVVVLRDIEGMSTAETAAVLDVSDEVVKTRLHRARSALRDRLFDRVGAGAGDAFQFLGHRCDRMVARVMAAIRESASA